jgi:E3 ubiquitin-protein ligase NRDP1
MKQIYYLINIFLGLIRMEEYINEKTIIKDEKWDVLKENIICSLCKKLMLKPVMCTSCQNYFCKNCIETKSKGNCPQKCENSSLIDAVGKNLLINKFKFKCIKGCGAEIPFNDIQKHYSSNCIKKEAKSKVKHKTKNIENKISSKYIKLISFIL